VEGEDALEIRNAAQLGEPGRPKKARLILLRFVRGPTDLPVGRL